MEDEVRNINVSGRGRCLLEVPFASRNIDGDCHVIADLTQRRKSKTANATIMKVFMMLLVAKRAADAWGTLGSSNI